MSYREIFTLRNIAFKAVIVNLFAIYTRRAPNRSWKYKWIRVSTRDVIVLYPSPIPRSSIPSNRNRDSASCRATRVQRVSKYTYTYLSARGTSSLWFARALSLSLSLSILSPRLSPRPYPVVVLPGSLATLHLLRTCKSSTFSTGRETRFHPLRRASIAVIRDVGEGERGWR